MEKLKQLTLENEIWLYIEDTDQKYAVSNLGRIASFHKPVPIIMRPHPCKNGYLKVIFHTGKNTCVMPHRIVAKHFVANPGNKPEVNHMNGVKLDNRAINLEWVTRGENVRHSVVNGLHKGFVKGHQVVNRPKGSDVNTSVLSEEMVRGIRADIASGITRRETAEKYKVKVSAVNSALTCWKWLK